MCNTVLLSIVIVLCITFLRLIYFISLFLFFIFLKILFIHSWETHTEREREREREREKQKHGQREKQAPCREPDVGLDPRCPGSCPGLKVALNRWATQAHQLIYFLVGILYVLTSFTHFTPPPIPLRPAITNLFSVSLRVFLVCSFILYFRFHK